MAITMPQSVGGGFTPVSAIASAAADFGSTWYANRLAQVNAREQMNFADDQYRTRYQRQVQDLMKAGLNPMLAYMQSPGSAPQGTAAPVTKPEPVRAYNDTRIASAQEANIAADTAKKSAERKNIDMDTLVKAGMPEYYAGLTVQATASASQAVAMVRQIQATLPKIEEEIKYLKTQQTKNKSDVQVNASIIELNQAYKGLKMAEEFLTKETTSKVHKEGDILEPKAQAAKMATGKAGAIADNVMKFIPFNLGVGVISK